MLPLGLEAVKRGVVVLGCSKATETSVREEGACNCCSTMLQHNACRGCSQQVL